MRIHALIVKPTSSQCRVVFKSGILCAIKSGQGFSEDWAVSPDDGLGFGVRGLTEGAEVSVGSLAAQDRTARRGVEALALSADGHLAGGADSARGFAGSRQRATTGRRARAGARSGLRARLAGVRRAASAPVHGEFRAGWRAAGTGRAEGWLR